MPKVADTLHVLLDHHGQIVEKAELMKLVWPEAVVEEVGLARNISLLRKLLEDENCIETIPRRGYRFVAPVTLLGESEVPIRRRWRWVAVVALVLAAVALIYWQFYVPSKYLNSAGLPGLAVVPFECLTPAPECAAFSSGVSELLVTDLSKLGGMNVVSPSTVRRHQKIGNSMGLMGRLLGLEVLLEGTAQKLDQSLKITTRLVDVHTGKLIWADNYEFPAADLNRAETEASRQIAAQVAAHLLIREPFKH